MQSIYRGNGKDVTLFSPTERRAHGLATFDTIVEVCGDDALMEEMEEYCISKGLVGYDVETSGLDFLTDRIVLAQIGDLERQYLIWLDRTNPDRLLSVLRNPDIVKIGLNLNFDIGFGLHKHRKKAIPRNVVDVFLTAQILTCGIYDNVGLTRKMTGMETQARHWLALDVPKDKELRIGWDGWDPIWFEERLNEIKKIEGVQSPAIKHLEAKRRNKVLYAADDVCIPLQIAHKHKPWLHHHGLVPTVNLENRFLPVLADIEVRGMPFDAEAWLKLAEEAEEGARKARRELDELFDVTVTIDIDENGNATYTRDKKYTSPQQLVDLIRDWMWENCGVDVIANNEHFQKSLERYETLNQDVIDRLFAPRQEPDPENPKKKKKFGYPKMSDVVDNMWDLYRHHLPDSAFVLPNTDSKTLKFLKIIYEADPAILQEDAEFLPTLHGIPGALLDPILELRGQGKNASTYGRNWLDILSSDGRVHTSFNQTELSTGRLSSSPNAQNFPRGEEYRACFRARPGYKMVGADYSQIEPRVIAQLSKDPTYMRVFWSEKPESLDFQKWCDHTVTEVLDLYTEVGKEIGQIPPHYTKKDTKGTDDTPPKPDGAEGRQQAKTANLGLGYGTGKNKFHYMLCLDTGEYHPRSKTDKLYDDYWGSMTVMKAYLDHASNLTDPTRSARKVTHPYASKEVTYAETVLGRKRFFEEHNPGWWTQGRNMPIQGTAGGDMLKQAALELTEWAWENDIDGGIVNLIHDEILAEVREDQAERFAKAMQYFMEKVGSQYCPDVPIVAGAYIADHWTKD